MELIMLALRTISGSIICLYALGKFSRLPFIADGIWRPTWVARNVFLVGIAGVAVLELVFGLLIVLCPLPKLYLIAFALMLCLGLSIYGNIALKKTGHCGCSGDFSGRGKPGVMWTRNFILFGIASLGVFLGPSFPELNHHSDFFIPYLAVLPAFGWILSLIIRIMTIRFHTVAGARQAAFYSRLQSYLLQSQ